jgi:hypothetical protein
MLMRQQLNPSGRAAIAWYASNTPSHGSIQRDGG